MPTVSFAATTTPAAKKETTAAVDQTLDVGILPTTAATPTDEMPPKGMANVGVVANIEIITEMVTG